MIKDELCCFSNGSKTSLGKRTKLMLENSKQNSGADLFTAM